MTPGGVVAPLLLQGGGATPSAVVFSDLHLESGSQLGWPDTEVGNTRIRDAQAVLEQIANEECDVLIFGGDAGRTARLGPTSYRVLQDALAASKAKYRLLVVGNHDWHPEANNALHVLEASVDRTVLLDRPRLVKAGGIQIGALPWMPPNKLFEKAKHSPREMNRLMADRLLALTRGLATKLNPHEPSLLVGHWLVSRSILPVKQSILEIQEPVLSSDDLRGCGPWDFFCFGHNHTHAKVDSNVWVVGSPMRTSFNEEGHTTGYLRLEWVPTDSNPNPHEWLKTEYVETTDRKLMTVEVEGGAIPPDPAYTDAVVRVRATINEGEGFDGRRIVEQLYDAGAHKVVGPQVTVHRTEQQRSDMTPEMEPQEALTRWLDAQGIDGRLRERALAEAERVMGAADTD
jgi:DNA repair exonuclease SbcCD nuclease subunit